jgi:hypothetical protein
VDISRPGGDFSVPAGINELGQIVGIMHSAQGGSSRAMLLEPRGEH